MSMLSRWSVGWVFVVGCAYKAPPESRGGLKLHLDNPLAAKLCSFSLTPVDAAKPSSNWLANRWQNGLHPYGSYWFDIRAGRYIARARFCEEGVAERDQCHGETELEISQNTRLEVGNADISGGLAEEAEWAHLKMPLEGNCAYAGCISTGGYANAPAECCSHRAYQNANGLQCSEN